MSNDSVTAVVIDSELHREDDSLRLKIFKGAAMEVQNEFNAWIKGNQNIKLGDITFSSVSNVDKIVTHMYVLYWSKL